MTSPDVRSVLALVATLAAFGPPALSAQRVGALAGTVVDQLTLERLEGVRITALDTDVSVRSDEFGQFLLEGLPIGSVSVRIEAPGYVRVVEQIEVADTDFLQVRLSPVAAALDELLVVTGRERRSVTRNEDDVAFRSALDILADDMPGVTVRRGGGNLGTGAAIALRGAGTFGDVTPAVYLDGVRIDERPGDARSANVLDLIPAETIARIRVLKGPAAAAAYALGANGVILIETRRGPGSDG